MKKNVCLIVIIMLVFPILSFGQENLSLEDFKAKLDSKVHELVLTNDDEKTFITTNIREELGNEIIDFHEKVIKEVGFLVSKNQFPQIHKNSLLSKKTASIYEDILRSSILSPDGNRILKAEFMIPENKDSQAMVKFVALRLKSFLERGKEIEKINPSEDQKTIIQNQYSELKNLVQSLAVEELDVPEEYINKAVDINFKRYEIGPDSVIQLWAKRPFSEETFKNIKSKINEAATSGNDTISINPISDDMTETTKRIKRDQFNFHTSLNFVNKLNQIIVNEYKQILIDEGIDENLREKFKPSESLAHLQKWYKTMSNNMENWRNKK